MEPDRTLAREFWAPGFLRFTFAAVLAGVFTAGAGAQATATRRQVFSVVGYGAKNDGCCLTKSEGAELRDSRAMPGTGVFLSTAPGELKSVVQINNVLGNAHVATEER